MAELLACPVCGSRAAIPGITLHQIPVVCHARHATRPSARAAPRADFALVQCRGCGHQYNQLFDPAALRYDDSYENALHHSLTFQAYNAQVIDQLAAYLPRLGGRILEIGCGQGEFLRQLCAQTGARGIGYDPALRTPIDTPDLCLVREESGADTPVPLADLVIARHVLEHLAQPQALLRTLRGCVAASPQATIWLEMPNGETMLAHGRVWDLLYEHVSYFTYASLTALCHAVGLTAQIMPTYGAQYWSVVARPTPIRDSALGTTIDRAIDRAAHATAGLAAFAADTTTILATWQDRLAAWATQGRRVVLWGAGTKSVMFLNLLDPATDGPAWVQAVVDINPAKQGAFVTGTGHAIVGPTALVASSPDVVVLLNPLYRTEVCAEIATLGLCVELVTV